MKNTDEYAKLFLKILIEELDKTTKFVIENDLGMSYNDWCKDLSGKDRIKKKNQDFGSFAKFVDTNSVKINNFLDIFSWSPAWTIHMSSFKSIKSSLKREEFEKLTNRSNFSISIEKRNVSVIDRTLLRLSSELQLNLPGISHEYYNIDNMLYNRFELDINFQKDYVLNKHCWIPIICVEHENKYLDWSDEIVKLMYIKADLKIVISYCSDDVVEKSLPGALLIVENIETKLKHKSEEPLYVILGPQLVDLDLFKTIEEKENRIRKGFRLYKIERGSVKNLV